MGYWNRPLTFEELKEYLLEYGEIPTEEKDKYEVTFTICDVYERPYYLVAINLKERI